jgi:SAM-dependent methyltransferase
VRSGFDPADGLLGGYPPLDGTMEFYGRVNALLSPDKRVLDLGAGRGAWLTEDNTPFRRSLRDIRPKVSEYIGADIDEAVFQNTATSRNLLISNGRVPCEDATFDIIICDYVFEHVNDVAGFSREVARLLKPGGVVCGRTPHALNYVSLAARLIRNERHAGWLSRLQPNRKPADIFPTAYKLNTRAAIRRCFRGWDDHSYLYTSEPQYYFGSRMMYVLFSLLHRCAPELFTGNIFFFLKKPTE